MTEETPLQLARRVAANPTKATDSDKLRVVANFLDVLQMREEEISSIEIQEFLRDLALRLERNGVEK